MKGRISHAIALGFVVSVASPPTSSRADIARGDWGEVLDLQFQAVHMIVLKNEKVLCISDDPDPPNQVRLWTPPEIGAGPSDPGTLIVIDPPTVPGSNPPEVIRLYCAGHTQLADGRVVLIGGGGGPPGHDHTVIFNPDSPPSDPWTPMVDMPPVQPPTGDPVPGKRWYATCTTLGDGTVLVLGGDRINQQTPHTADIPLIFNPDVGTEGEYTQYCSARGLLDGRIRRERLENRALGRELGCGGHG